MFIGRYNRAALTGRSGEERNWLNRCCFPLSKVVSSLIIVLALYKTQSVIVSPPGILNVCVCKLETGESERFSSPCFDYYHFISFFFFFFFFENSDYNEKKKIYKIRRISFDSRNLYIFLSFFGRLWMNLVDLSCEKKNFLLFLPLKTFFDISSYFYIPTIFRIYIIYRSKHAFKF